MHSMQASNLTAAESGANSRAPRVIVRGNRCETPYLFYDVRHDFYIRSSAIGQSGSISVAV